MIISRHYVGSFPATVANGIDDQTCSVADEDHSCVVNDARASGVDHTACIVNATRLCTPLSGPYRLTYKKQIDT